jgi:hypothetical protein
VSEQTNVPVVQKQKNEEVKKVLSDSRYFVFEKEVFYDGGILKDADADTFRVLNAIYAVDKNVAYYNGEVIGGADALSFKSFGKVYATDNKAVYTKGRIIQNIKPVSFSVLGENFVGGDGRVFYDDYIFDGEIVGADLATFQVIDADHGKDSKHVFNKKDVMLGVDPIAFQVSQNVPLIVKSNKVYGYTNGKDTVYYSDDYSDILDQNFDPALFKELGNHFAKDKNHVYYFGKTVELDPATFQVLSDVYQKDKNGVYTTTDVTRRVLEGADPATFEALSVVYAKDKGAFYYKDQILKKFYEIGCGNSVFGCKKKLEPYTLEIEWLPVLVEEKVEGRYYSNYYAGTVLNGDLKGGKIYLNEKSFEGMDCGGWWGMEPIERYVRIDDLNVDVTDWKIRDFVDFGDLPKEIVYPGTSYKFEKFYRDRFDTSDVNKKLLIDDKKIGKIYSVQGSNSDDDYVYLETSDHILVFYKISLSFMTGEDNSGAWNYESKGKITIKLEDGKIFSGDYVWKGYETASDIAERVKPIGTADGETIYTLKSEEDGALKDLYKNYSVYWGDGSFSYDQYPSYTEKKEDIIYTKKFTYEEFLAKKPVLYWKDLFGRWLELEQYEIVDMIGDTIGGKCKPVIYLYPKSEGNFNVQVKPLGDFIYTNPVYGKNGWNVRAYPDGSLVDLSDLKKYPYLFWESAPVEIPRITEGWIVDRQNLKSFLTEKLNVLGLNKKEITDFNEFWVARLEREKTEKFKIMFLNQKEFDRFAPLSVTGVDVPDTTIRVIMYVSSATKNEFLPEQKLPLTPVRSGFTVVEWGGSILTPR